MMEFSLKCVNFVGVSILFFSPTDCLKKVDMTIDSLYFFQHEHAVYFEMCEFRECLSSLFFSNELF